MSMSDLQATAPSVLDGMAAGQPFAPPSQQQFAQPNPLQPTQLPAPAAIAPGTPQGAPPANPASGMNDQTVNLADNPLAQYAQKLDNDGNPVKPTTPTFKKVEAPTQEQLKPVIAQLAGSVAIDQDLAALAVGGGEGAAEALGKLLSGVISDSMGKAIHASMAGSAHMGEQRGDQTAQQAASSVTDTNYMNEATAAATSGNPELATGMKATLLTTAINELRKQFPTAPANLLGQHAAAELGMVAPAAAPKDNATDWSKHLASQYL